MIGIPWWSYLDSPRVEGHGEQSFLTKEGLYGVAAEAEANAGWLQRLSLDGHRTGMRSLEV
jgi:hypothetical protein